MFIKGKGKVNCGIFKHVLQNANELQLQQHRLSLEKILVKETRNKITYTVWVHVNKM